MRRPFLFGPRESARAPDRGRSSSPDRVRYRSSDSSPGRPLELPIGTSSSPLPPALPDPLAVQLGRVPRPLRPRSVPVVRDRLAGIRGPWSAIGSASSSLYVIRITYKSRCPLFAQVLEPRAANVRTWAAGHGPRTARAGEFFDVHGPQKTAGFVKARALARFHTLDVLQNSSGSTWNEPPTPWQGKTTPVDQLVNSCKNLRKIFLNGP